MIITAHSSGGISLGGRGNTTQVQKILNWAASQVGSDDYHGYCQAFVYRAVTKGIGEHESSNTAKIAREKWMIKGTGNDLKPPAGAAVYFYGTGSNAYINGHVALSAGNGYIYDPITTVQKSVLRKNMNGGYLGWGWEGGIIPTGAVSSISGLELQSGPVSSAASSSASASAASSNPLTAAAEEKAAVEISTVVIKSETGSVGERKSDNIRSLDADSDLFLLIQGDDKIYKPLVCDSVKVTRERTGAPSKMTFTVVDIDGMNISNGCAAAFRYKNKKIFYGYIFSLERNSEREKVDIVCYDQLRYFKNQDSFVYNKKYSDLLKYLCDKYKLKTGTIEDTGYKIPTRIEDGSLFDICADAKLFTYLSNGKNYVLYDDFGEICLRSSENLLLPLLIDKDTTGKWALKESIDSGVYNRIVVKKDNSETGERELYIANDSETQKKWGVLSYTEEGGENSTSSALKSKAKSMLKYYNRENKTFRVSNCLGHTDARGGSTMLVSFDFGNGEKIQNPMMIEKVEHTFTAGAHLMDLNLFGGDYSA